MTADKSVDATEEAEHQVIVTDTAQLENDSNGLVKEKNASQKRYRQYVCSSSNELYALKMGCRHECWFAK